MKRSFFTLIELLVVVAIIAILMSILLPALKNAKDSAKFAKWQVYSKNMLADPDLILFYTFQENTPNQALNKAYAMDWNLRKPSDLNTSYKTGTPVKSQGRWKRKKAVMLDNNSCLNRTDHQLLNFGKDDNFTISVWAKPFRSGDSRGDIVSKMAIGGTGHPGYRIYYSIASDVLVVHCRVDCDGEVRWDRGTVDDFKKERWVHFCMTVNRSGKIKLYIDGKKSAGPSSANLNGWKKDIGNTNNLYIGRGNNGYAEMFIDELGIIKRELTASEVNILYQAGMP